MQTISKSKLKANMLRVFREVEASGEALVVTDRDRPVLRILPISGKGSVDEVFGHIKGKPVYYEDIDTPTAEEWPDLR